MPSSFRWGFTGEHIGSFAMGLFVVAAHQKGLSVRTLFVMTGFWVGLPRFRRSRLRAVTLMERGH